MQSMYQLNILLSIVLILNILYSIYNSFSFLLCGTNLFWRLFGIWILVIYLLSDMVISDVPPNAPPATVIVDMINGRAAIEVVINPPSIIPIFVAKPEATITAAVLRFDLNFSLSFCLLSFISLIWSISLVVCSLYAWSDFVISGAEILPLLI